MIRPTLIRLAASLLLSAGLGACAKSDSRLEQLSAGIPKDSVLRVMGVNQPEKYETYLIAGYYIEAMYFPLPGATDSAAIADRNMSPVILSDGKLVAWGWAPWDSMAAVHKIAVAPE